MPALPREAEARRLRNLRSLRTRVPGPKHFQRVKWYPSIECLLAQLDDGRIQDGVEERGEDKWLERRATKGPPKPLAKNCGGDRGQSQGGRRQKSQMLPVNGPRMQAAQRMFRPRHKASAIRKSSAAKKFFSMILIMLGTVTPR